MREYDRSWMVSLGGWTFADRALSLLVLVSLVLAGACSGPRPTPYVGKVHRPGEQGGSWQQLAPGEITEIFGVGLSYARHIEETGSTWDPADSPPIFRKAVSSLNRDNFVSVPTRKAFLAMAESVEPGLAGLLDQRFQELLPLLDYEVELAAVLLEPYDRHRQDDPMYMPRIGFVLAGDFSSRTMMVLGQGQADIYEFWGAAKSFPGFAAVGSRMWVPETFPAHAVMAVSLETTVNGVVRQRGSSSDNVYPLQLLLRYVADSFPDASLQRGTVVMTGTPPGVAFQTPWWKRRLADILQIDRFTLVDSVLDNFGDDPEFLHPGDVVSFQAEGFGEMRFTIR